MSNALRARACAHTHTHTHTHTIMTPSNMCVLTHDKGFEAHK